ncbi:vacuolar heme ABC transmembrane exporter Abc3 [Schizosaccharomyces pombe]|uniref:Vacuolar heme ABC transmembrane exporter abc3 n=1 Tax=Schizosaccharomyces pombe (strain 972 / ATCC 24843) TaxID=284812 RepID=ABC3_SCHPO|nr:multi drug resistance-associated protein abc3 [Schizosaccharomyces pombe]Q9P5N0.1 RecName: Full=Vacuolar heme ABC transmembrane exporter abc3 [Schizosaccharomyces pombe 972h-]CAB91574.1 ABC transporter Abc3, unknown specificity [Schizosaccharomyces pombe]|eukprot:NP_595055.1 multi drug resistance-associated protein abc3 [Schizosaccharomyces pombe]
MITANKGLSLVLLIPNLFALVSGGLQYVFDVRRRIFRPHFSQFWTIWMKFFSIALVIITQIYVGYKTKNIGWNFFSVVTYCFVLFLQFAEQSTLRVPMASLLIFWLLKVVTSLLILLFSPYIAITSMARLLTLITLFCSLVCFISEVYVPPCNRVWYSDDTNEVEEKGIRPSEVRYANIFSKLSFSWISSFIKFGYTNYLKESDVWLLPPDERSGNLIIGFEDWWIYHSKNKRRSLFLWKLLFFNHWKLVALITITKLIQDVLAFVQPTLIQKTILFISSYTSPNPESPSRGFIIAILVLVANFLQTLLLQQYNQLIMLLGMRWKTELLASIYRKSLLLSSSARQNRSIGDIINYMAVDTQKISDLPIYLFIIVSGPFQIALALSNLYHLMGYSAFTGVAASVILFPCNIIVANVYKKFQSILMKNKDSRSKLMTEIINNIRSIKLYAWETPFLQKLLHIRNTKELSMLKKIGFITAIGDFAWIFTTIIVTTVAFGAFIIFHGKTQALTADIVFPAVSLFNLLQFPLAMLPTVISSLLEASVSVSRIYEFLIAQELDYNGVQRFPATEIPHEICLEIKSGTFSWSKKTLKQQVTPTLRQINFVAKNGELTCIFGKVGAGKSSLLEACMGNMYKNSGSVFQCGSLAYAAQQPWIFDATIRENILFGSEFDPELYEKTIHACCLKRDFEIFTEGDQTEVGQKGASLSGGQKSRISLARAIYSQADIYLLDDVLSSVDQHVSRDLIKNLFGPEGFLRTHCVVLTTNSLNVLKEADSIYILSNGKIVEKGNYEHLFVSTNSELKQQLSEFNDEKDTQPLPEHTTSYPSTQISLAPSIHVEGLETYSSSERKDSSNKYKSRKRNPIRQKVTEDDKGKCVAQTDELVQRGKVKWHVYWMYFKSCSIGLILLYFFFIISGIMMNVATNVWLKHWSEENGKSSSELNPSPYFYLGIYLFFGFLSCAFISSSSLTMTVLCGIRSGRYLHDSMLKTILRAPMGFFETTSSGRILNRFSNDVYKVDEVVSLTFMFFFRNSIQVLFILGVICYSAPLSLLLIVPLFFLYLYNRAYYVRTSRELKRLDNVTRSPLYAHVQESLSGLSTIRAYGMQETFVEENDLRIDTNHRVWFMFFSSSRWQAIRVECIGDLIIFCTAFYGILSAIKGSPNPGLVGFSLSYAIQITQGLSFIVQQSVDAENNTVSVERILEYINVKSEAPEIIPENRPPCEWPTDGAVSFNHYSAKYREDLSFALNNINIEISPREKIGIVGRTGAGKSTLAMALFRIIEPTEGKIEIDNEDITKFGLYDLRSRLSIIPQESQIFEGNIRENLDPNHRLTDKKIWEVLEIASLKNCISQLEDGLYSRVAEGGANFSSGQRQLICLARVLLTSTRILLLDEATASVHAETDAIVQQTIRKRFKDRTILTVAHRINTVMDSDRILVLDHGKVVEFDATKKLLENKDSMFYSLAKESGLI